jgi:hypothetical protein
MWIAKAMFIAGIGVVVPGLLDVFMELINKTFRLGIDLTVPKWAGWLLLASGVALAIWLRLQDDLSSHSPSKSGKKYVAVTHSSFPTATQNLGKADLGVTASDEFVAQACDLSPFFAGASPDLTGALRQQGRLIEDLRASQRSQTESVYGYAGIVHIPLQFHLGSAISTGRNVRLFDKERVSQQWRELQPTGPSLGVEVNWGDAPDGAAIATVRVEVSYRVDAQAVREVVPPPSIEVVISLDNPRLDAVTAYSQIEEMCVAFRKLMDDLHQRLPPHGEVHVFYAGPVCLGFSLGRQLSRTIHPKTFIYNYDRQSRPAYAWSIAANSSQDDVRVAKATCERSANAHV